MRNATFPISVECVDGHRLIKSGIRELKIANFKNALS
jgi:hypothetical protein